MKEVALKAKEDYRTAVGGEGDVKKKVLGAITSKLGSLTNLKNFTFPIHASYFAKGFSLNKCSIFGSKLVPVLIAARSSESKDKDINDEKNIFRVIYKCGN